MAGGTDWPIVDDDDISNVAVVVAAVLMMMLPLARLRQPMLRCSRRSPKGPLTHTFLTES